MTEEELKRLRAAAAKMARVGKRARTQTISRRMAEKMSGPNPFIQESPPTQHRSD